MFLTYIINTILLLYAILKVTWILWKRKLSFLPSAPNVPWLGCIPYFSSDPHKVYKIATTWNSLYNHLYVVWVAFMPVIRIGSVEYIKPLLKSQDVISKSLSYQILLRPWLGEGLLISTRDKWKKRRVALTGAFHFAILNDFMEVFERHALEVVKTFKVLTSEVKEVEIQWPVSLATLDVICETSMGVSLNALNSSDSDYVTAVGDIKRLTLARFINPFLFFSDTLYKLTSNGRKYYECLETLHNFTINVINEHIASKQNKSAEVNLGGDHISDQRDNEQRKVLIDVLIDLYDKGEIDIEGIREEVDTFMFEGHDTVSSALSWTLYEIGRHSEVQAKLYEEITSVSSKQCTFTEKIRSLRYAEYVIKESMRLHPPVPLFERMVEKDFVVNDSVIPRGTVMLVDSFSVHMNPAYWDQPSVFDPSRFEDLEFANRNPYCYLPFSAGPRNCIGQKFAMLEMKVFVYYILSNFCLESLQTPDEIETGIDVITHSMNGINIEFFSRQ